MKILGKVLHIGSRGPIVKCRFAPKPGATVFTKDGKRVGEIYTIFGPVSEPYAVLKPASRVDPSGLVGTTGYYGEGG